jgi:serine/threonine-protein kinase
MTSRLSEPFTVNGRYEITERPLGEGGTGLVYKAYDHVRKGFVAFKALWPDARPDCFDGQWAALSALRHPNIVEILDTGVWISHGEQRPYFVMPLLSGATLDQLKLPLPVDRVVDIVLQVCRALQAAHQQGLVHGDIHPRNLFIMRDETVKILDLGVRRRNNSPLPSEATGTLFYRAPEQLDLKPATPLSDIFSLGVVCYEALTGRQPFARESAAAAMEAIRTQVPASPSEINPAVNQTLSRTVHKAMAKQPSHRFSHAREFAETLEKALRSEPIERFERAKIQPRIERVKKAHSEGDDEFALEILTELESEGNIQPDMPALRTQIVEALRQKNIRQLLENARIRMEEEEFPLALQKIAGVVAIDPENSAAKAMKERIERLRTEQQLEDWFQFVREHLEANRFGPARRGLQEVLQLDSSNTQARQMLAEIDQTEHEIVKVREEKQRLYESAAAAHRNGEIANALDCLEKALAIPRRGMRWSPKGADAPAPELREPSEPAKGADAHQPVSLDLDEQCQAFYEQVRGERDGARRAYDEGRQHLREGNVGHALEICEEYLKRHPGDPMFQALQLEADEVRRREHSTAIAQVNARVDAEPDLDKKYAILEDAIETYPNESHFRSALKLIRDRRDLVNAIVSRARQHEERAQFDDAAGQWDILRNIYPLFPGLDSACERLARRKEERAKADAKAAWIAHIDAHFSLGEYAEASSVAAEALREFPDDRALLEWQSLAEQGVQRSAESNALLKEGRDLCAALIYQDGLELLRKAQRLDPRNYTARAALLSGLVAQARELIAHDWHAGEPLVKEALDLEPSDPVARTLLSVLDDHRRQDVIAGILSAARTYQADGHLPDALQLLERGLVQYPNDQRLTQLLNSLTTQAGQAPPPPATIEAAAPTVPFSAEATQPRLFTAPSTIAVASAEAGGASAPETSAADGVDSAALIAIGRHRPTSRPRVTAPPLRVPPPVQNVLNEVSFQGPVWGIAALVALALILAAGVYSLLNKPKSSAASGNAAARRQAQRPGLTRIVEFAANVPGASFSEAGKPLALASELSLGNHSVEASHEGYMPEVKSFTVAAANSPLPVNFALQPMLPQLRLSSSIESGKLLLDEAESLELRSGSASKEALALGSHTVKIYDRGRLAFAFAFQAEPNQKPMLMTPLLTQPLAGAVVVSLRGSAKIYTTRGLRVAPLDPQVPGLPLAAVPPLGLEIAGSSANPARFLLETGKGGHPLPESADGSAVPTLSVQLAGAAAQTSLTVTSNVPNCVVSVDGQALKQPMNGTAQSLTLAPGSHSIGLACPGYREAEQTADIRIGDPGPHKMKFAMTALPTEPQVRRAVLTIAGAPPEALVFQNQVRVGTVGLDGSFSKEIDPGTYSWEWRKAGFEPRKESRAVTAGESLLLAGALTPSTGSLLLKVLPESARISARRDADGIPLVLPNNSPVQLAGGSYRVTAEAPDYTGKTEALFITPGKPLAVTWELAKAPIVPPPARFFKNGDSWQQISDGGWWICPGAGYSSLRSSTGSFSIDFLRRKANRNKKISFLADCLDSSNCIVYSLDGHTFTSKRIAAGKTVVEEKQPHGMDDNSSFHLLFEMSADAIVVKNRSGAVLSKMERRESLGTLMIQNDNPLNID